MTSARTGVARNERTARRARRKFSGRYTPLMQSVTLEHDYDLTVFVCQFLEEVQEIEQIKGWRERSRVAVVFLLESWTATFPDYPRELELLSRFDHVFVLNASGIEAMRQRVTAPVRFLPSACDTLLATPIPAFPPRAIDLLCFGRWDEADHAKLIRLSRQEGLFYHYDVWTGLRATDWMAVRQRNAAMIQRARECEVVTLHHDGPRAA